MEENSSENKGKTSSTRKQRKLYNGRDILQNSKKIKEEYIEELSDFHFRKVLESQIKCKHAPCNVNKSNFFGSNIEFRHYMTKEIRLSLHNIYNRTTDVHILMILYLGALHSIHCTQSFFLNNSP